MIKHCACLIPNVHYMDSFGQLLQREICPCSLAPNLPSGSCPKWGIRAGSVPRTWVSDSLAHTESLFFPVLSRGQMSIKNDEAKFIWKPCKMPFFNDLTWEVLCGCVFFSKFTNPGFCPCPVETAHPPFSVSRRIAFLLFQFCNFLRHCPVWLIMKGLQ